MTGTNSSPAKEAFAHHRPWLIFWVGFLLRVLVITVAHTYRIRVLNDHFGFGWEMGRIARALVTGYGYADPFAIHTGPTAWVPPLYPLLMAAVFKVAGIYTAQSAWIVLTLNSVFSAATAIFIYEIAARCYNRKVALWSAWLWALYPAALQYAVHWIWEMSLTTFLFTWTLALALRMRGISPPEPQPERGPVRGDPGIPPREQVRVREGSGVGDPEDDTIPRQTTSQWLLFGLLWGLIALSNSTLLFFLPVCGIWILFGARPLSSGVKHATLAALLFLAVIAPWTIRNWRVFHTFVPLRSNLGVELWAFNKDGANGIALEAPVQPSQWGPSFLPYFQMGEIAYSKYRGSIAKHWIASHPREFILLSIRRFYFFWVSVPHPLDKHPLVEYIRELNYCFASVTGLMGLFLSLRRRLPAAGLFGMAFLLLPFTYYFVSVAARFRHPLEPLIAIFTVYLFQSTEGRVKATTPNS